MDDDQHVTDLLAVWLADAGEVYAATTSAQAIALASVVRPDLAVLDVILPRMDGFALAGAIRQQPGLADMPVIFVTGSDRLDILARADELEPATVLYKPLDPDSLARAVLGLLKPPAAPV